MKKFFILVLAVAAFSACSSLNSLKESAVNCKYAIAGAEVVDASFSTLDINVAMAVTNQSKTTTAKMNRFEGKLYINDNPVSDISFGSYEVAPASTAIVQTKLSVPFTSIGKNIAGLVMANSMSLTYKMVGKIYFDTPIGEVPFPIVVEPAVKDK